MSDCQKEYGNEENHIQTNEVGIMEIEQNKKERIVSESLENQIEMNEIGIQEIDGKRNVGTVNEKVEIQIEMNEVGIMEIDQNKQEGVVSVNSEIGIQDSQSNANVGGNAHRSEITEGHVLNEIQDGGKLSEKETRNISQGKNEISKITFLDSITEKIKKFWNEISRAMRKFFRKQNKEPVDSVITVVDGEIKV